MLYYCFMSKLGSIVGSLHVKSLLTLTLEPKYKLLIKNVNCMHLGKVLKSHEDAHCSLLQQDHLKRFKVTWDLHNKHLFQSVAFSEPTVKNSISLLITQLRYVFIFMIYGPVHEILILIVSGSYKCSGESALMCSLARAFTVLIHKYGCR